MYEGLDDVALSWLVHRLHDEVERTFHGEDGGLETVQRGWEPQFLNQGMRDGTLRRRRTVKPSRRLKAWIRIFLWRGRRPISFRLHGSRRLNRGTGRGLQSRRLTAAFGWVRRLRSRRLTAYRGGRSHILISRDSRAEKIPPGTRVTQMSRSAGWRTESIQDEMATRSWTMLMFKQPLIGRAIPPMTERPDL